MKRKIILIVLCLMLPLISFGDEKCFDKLSHVSEFNYKINYDLDQARVDVDMNAIFHTCGVGGQVLYSVYFGKESRMEKSEPAVETQVKEDAIKYFVSADKGYLSGWKFNAVDVISPSSDKEIIYPSMEFDRAHIVKAIITGDIDRLSFKIFSRKVNRELSDNEMGEFIKTKGGVAYFNKPLGVELSLGVFVKKEEGRNSCDDISKEVKRLKNDIESLKAAKDQHDQMYYEICFSHGGGMSQNCYQMAMQSAELTKNIAALEEKMEKLVKEFEASCK